MKKVTFLVFILFIVSFNISNAQSINNWRVKKSSETSKSKIKIDRKTIPRKYKVMSLDFESMQNNLKSTSIKSQNKKVSSNLVMDFPLEDGTMESFSLEKTSVLAPELEAKYPEINLFMGLVQKTL